MQVKSWYFDGDCLCKDKRKKCSVSGRPFFLRRDSMSTHSKTALRSLFIWTNVLKSIGQNGVRPSRMRSSPPHQLPLAARAMSGARAQRMVHGRWCLVTPETLKNFCNLCLGWKYCRNRIDSVVLSQTALSTRCLILWKQRRLCARN